MAAAVCWTLEHLETLPAHIEGNGPRTVLDLDEVTLVDVAVVC
jgi:hypothetical protein